jgi:hypothetical protein
LIGEREDDPLLQTQIVDAKPPVDGALPDSAATFNVVRTPFDTVQDHVAAGSESLPAAFRGMFTGQSFGKTAVKVT